MARGIYSPHTANFGHPPNFGAYAGGNSEMAPGIYSPHSAKSAVWEVSDDCGQHSRVQCMKLKAITSPMTKSKFSVTRTRL